MNRIASSIGLVGLLTVMALVGLATPSSAVISQCVGGSSVDKTYYTSNGHDQYYEHYTRDSCKARISGTEVCLLTEDTYSYQAEQHGSDSWEDSSSSSSSALACTPTNLQAME